MTPARPIEIVGGGLAGLALGAALVRDGVSVTLYEAGGYPRHRVCGEFITGLPDRTRATLGLDPWLRDAVPNRTVGWYLPGEPPREHALPSPALGLSRFALDHRLARAFVGAGGDLRTGTRVPMTTDAPGRIFATGRRRSRPAWLGLKIHAVRLALAQDLEFHLGQDAYIGLARIEQHQVNICGLFRARALGGRGADLMRRYLVASGLSELADRLRHAALDDESFCAVAAVGFDARVPREPCVRVGDACAMIPPFTGNGMAMAFQGAELAHGPLLAYARGRAEWPETRRDIARLLRRRFRLRLASASVLHPFLLQSGRQRWLALLNRCRLLPLRPLYALLH